MYISTAYVSSAYLGGCDDGNLPADDYFIVRRSMEWDLANTDQRFEAALAFLGCLNYLMDGIQGVHGQG